MTTFVLRLAALAFTAVVLLAPTASPLQAQSTITVTTGDDENNTDGDCSLREAVAAANSNSSVDDCTAGSEDGDTIEFSSTAFVADQTITLTMGELSLIDDVTIDGDASTAGSDLAAITIDGNNNSRIFNVDVDERIGSEDKVSFVTLELTNGNSSDNSSNPDAGGAVDIKSGDSVTFTDVNVTNSTAGLNGGGIHAAGGTTLTVTTSDGGTSTISGNEAEGGDAGMGGGGVWGAGATTISGDVTIEDNTASGESGSGGGVLNFGGTLDIMDATIQNNTANRAGGGIENFDGDDDGDHTITVTNATITGNSVDEDANPGNGGGLHSGGGTVEVTGGLINENVAVEGGGLWTSGTLTLSDGATVSADTATGDAADDGGGGIYNMGGDVTLSGDATSITGNVASGESGSGGGILNNGGILTVENAAFIGNAANRAGGGIEDAGGSDDDDTDVTLTDATLNDNLIGENANPGNGGGLHSDGGDVEITGGTVNGNTAVEGGGLWTSGALTVSGSTVDGNEATGDDGPGPGRSDGGGGIYLQGGNSSGTITSDASVTNNTASGESGSGGGILNNGGALTVENAALIGNAANRAGGGIEDAGGSDDDDTDVTLTDATLNDNLIGENANPGNGGGLHSDGGDVEITGGTVNGNTAVEGGGLWTSGALTVSGSTVDGNEATGDDGPGPGRSDGGGGIYLQGGNSSGTITSDASVTNNTASGESGSGGGILNNGGALTVTDSEVSGNAANRAGGGIEDGGGTVTLTNATVDANTIGTANPGNGGGLHSGGGDVTISGGQFMNNTAVEGGGLWTNGTIIVQDSLTVADNEATGDAANQGGGGLYVHVGGSATLDSASVEGNVASGENGSGGGILVSDNSTVTLLGGAISDNMANRAGGGLEVADSDTTDGPASITLMRVTVRGDSTSMEDANPGNGGGIHIGGAGEATISRSTFSANYAEEGGGLWASGSSTLDVSGSTVSGNRAGGNTGGGGGVYDNGGATITITSSTVARNSALSEGGGLRSTGGSFAFGNTIVADNNSGGQGPNCVGEFTSNDYNLIADASDCTINGDTGNNITGQDAMLAVLAYNGGPTRTHRPMEDSPVIDAGSNLGGSDVDQRGFERTLDTDDNANVDDGTDIGSVEFGADDTPIEDGPDALEGDFRLSKAYPNPTMGATRFELAVGRTQHVTARAYDVLGRRVATLHDGVLSSGGSKQLRLQAGELAAGVYVVRVTGESFRATRKVTVTR